MSFNFIRLFFFVDFSYFLFSFSKHSSIYFCYWYSEYGFLFFYIFSCLVLSLLLFLLSFLLMTKSASFEKGSPYECGFEPFISNIYLMFNIQYFLVGILFLLFDLEIVYLITWVLYLGSLSVFSFWVVLVFLGLLVIGFIYEWKNGALEWV